MPLKKKLEPRPIEVIDGRPLSSGLVTHETTPLSLHVGLHSELLVFDVVKLGHYPVILGVSWLKKHNPTVIWSLHELRFDLCAKTCGGPFPTVTAFPEFPDSSSFEEHSAALPDVSLISSDALQNSKTHDELFLMSVSSANANEENSPPVETIVPLVYHQFLDIFSKEAADQLPPSRSYDHRIPLIDGGSPPHGPIYSLSEVELNALSLYLDENLKKGFIRPSSSPAGAPILFVKKKDGSLRLCVDYRGLNKVTVKNRYPLPLISELLDRLQGATIFTRIDLRGAYNLVRIASGEEWKTAFRTRYGHYEYLVMPFGLTNAPATFQNLMNDVLREYLDQFVIVYLDDILIYSKNETEHVEHVMLVFNKLRSAGLFCKAEKCEFHKPEVEFLGYVMSSEGVKMDPSKVACIRSWPPPTSVKELQVFLGFANFYRRFIKNYAIVTAPLTTLLKKDVLWNFHTAALQAFETLKSAFITAPILMHFDPSLKIVIETDASDYALGAILSQIHPDNRTHPVAFYGRKFSAAEINYDIYDKEMLGVISAIQEWRAYLEGSRLPFTILTDHKNLEYFTSARSLNRRQARWAEFLAGYEFEIVYRPGQRNGKADALSRRHDFRPEKGENDLRNIKSVIRPDQFILGTSSLTSVSAQSFRDRIIECLQTDDFFLSVSKYLDDQTLERPPEVNARLNSLSVKNNVLLRDGKLYVPDNESLRLDIFRKCHDSPAAGHYGHQKTFELVSRNFWWPGMRKMIIKYINTCEQCQRNKTPRHKPFGLLKPLPIPSRPLKS